ncbi:MAG: PIG-L family deacetylase [Cyclobacteriaceae bacterium]
MRLIKFVFSFILLLAVLAVSAQKPKSYHKGEIEQMLKKLNVLGTVLYVAAHPDDENTSLIGYYANEELYRTAYLSATRGDGGQNLIGPEIREGLGIIRTQELLAARRIDRGQQFFSRANDFGYSKHPDETLTIWDKEKVLADFVRVIRTFRPDVMITRFSQEPGVTHGHHTTSAIIAMEAFKLAGDPNAFPDQVKALGVWQPKKIFWNPGRWSIMRSGGQFDPTGKLQVDVGAYNELLGESYNETSARSRSMHKSQGFGRTGTRGQEIDYLVQWAGDTSINDIFDGLDNTWSRVDGAETVAKFMQLSLEYYQKGEADKALGMLLEGRKELLGIADGFWKEVKLKEMNEAIRAITGMYLEVVSDDYLYTNGDSITLKLEAVARQYGGVTLKALELDQWNETIEIEQVLELNQKVVADYVLPLPKNLKYTNPYWLNDKATIGMYDVEDPSNIGKPENDPLLSARFLVEFEGQLIEYTVPVSYKRSDPVDGEVYRPLEYAPPAMVNLSTDLLLFADNAPQTLSAKVIAGKLNVKGALKLVAPADWKVSPESADVALSQKLEEQIVEFSVTPPRQASEAMLTAQLTLANGSKINVGRVSITYDHIPVQTTFPKATTKLIKLDARKQGELVGYIMGAGDDVPGSLINMGYQVEMLQKDDVLTENLAQYDAIVLGVRAFNTLDWLAYKNKELFEYVENGGTMIVQYNTSHRLVTSEIAPFSLQLSRDRVTVEQAPVSILQSNHPVMSFPNKITEKDFENWVQERGLYFPNQWSDNFVPILSSNDPGESAKEGGLLVAPYGKGYYIYSGYSWFRELPAGVPGAYRIFANMISIGKNETSLNNGK